MTGPAIPRGGIRRLYSVLWTHVRGMRARMVFALSLLVGAQIVRVMIPWLFGCAVNELQSQGGDGVRRASWFLLAMLAAAVLAWAMHGPARILEQSSCKASAGSGRTQQAIQGDGSPESLVLTASARQSVRYNGPLRVR